MSKVYFKCISLWYEQKDGFAMGLSLAVIVANLWNTNLIIEISIKVDYAKGK